MSIASSINKQLEDIKQDVGRLGNKIARGVAQKALIDMKDAHTAIINDYYSGYTPHKTYSYISPKTGNKVKTHGYRRTDNFKDNSIIPMDRVGNIGTHRFYATVTIGSSGMSDYTNQMGLTFPASGVFNLIWNMNTRGLPVGYIGHVGDVNINTSFNGIEMRGSPNNAMDNFMENWWKNVGSKEADRIAKNK